MSPGVRDELDEAVQEHPLDVSPTALLTMKRRVPQLSALWEGQSRDCVAISGSTTPIACRSRRTVS